MSVIYLIRGRFEGRVTSLCVVELEVAFQMIPGLRDGIIRMQVDCFILDTAPQPFNKDIVHPAALAIDGDSDPVLLEFIGKGL